VFRRTNLTADDVAAIEKARQRAASKGGRDGVTIVGRTLFLHTPDGLGRSELAAQLSRTGPNSTGTARNWATVQKLMAMLED